MFLHYYSMLSAFNKWNGLVVYCNSALSTLTKCNIVACTLTTLEASNSIYAYVTICFTKKHLCKSLMQPCTLL